MGLLALGIALPILLPVGERGIEMPDVVARFQPGQHRLHRRGDIADEAKPHRRAAAEMRGIGVDLDDVLLLGIVLRPGEIGAETQEDIGVCHRLDPGPVAEDAGHADVEGVPRLQEFLGARAVDDRCLQPVSQRHDLLAGVLRAIARVDRHRPRAVQRLGQRIEFTF